MNRKSIYKHWSLIINDSLSNGNLHYFITINFSKDVENIKLKIEELEKIIENNIQLISYFYIVPEKNKNNKWHLHLILSLKTFIGRNECILKNVEKLLCNSFELDTDIKNLTTDDDIKRATQYLYKEENFNKECLELHKLKYSKETCLIFGNFLNYLETECEIYNYNVGYINNIKDKEDKILGIISRKNDIDFKETTVLHFWLYYLELNDIYIYNNSLYKKVEGYLIAYKKFQSIDFLYNEFDEIFKFFICNFPIHFERYDITKLKTEGLIKISEKLEKLESITQNKIKPTFKFLEFKDGIYNYEIDKFLPKKKINENFVKNIEKISTIKYYNRTFKHLEEPKIWINSLKNALENNEDEFKDLCCYIANIIHNTDELFNKKRVMYVHGSSNTQKTTLISKPLITFFERDNIGFITSSNSSFNLQNLKNKVLGLFDEYTYKSTMKSELLKLFEGQSFITDVKFKEHTTIEKTPIIIISNHQIKETNETDKEALENRIRYFIFKRKINPKDANNKIDDEIKKEEAQIIIFCNKLFSEKITNNKKSKMNYKKQIEHILN